MSKKVIALIASLCLVFLCFAAMPEGAKETKVSAAVAQDTGACAEQARFLNILNHNFVYGSDFDNLDVMINNSIIALLDSSEGEFIKECYVRDYMKDIFGIELDDLSMLNAEFPSREGYVYIIPRGFSMYKHSFVSASLNEDGSYSVVTEVTIDTHDGEHITAKAHSLFVESAESAVGYNLIYSNIIENGSDI